MDLVKFAFFTTIISPLLVIQQQAGAAPVCKDLNSKCPDYSRLCSYDHVKQQCPLTCNQCGTIHPSSPVTSTSSHLMNATQSTVVVSQSLTAMQSTGPISQVTSVSQSLTPTQSTASVSTVLSQMQSRVVPSQGLLNGLPTQKADVARSSSVGLSESQVLTQRQSSVGLSQGLLNSLPTQKADAVRSSSVGLSVSQVLTQTQSSVDLSQGLVKGPPTQNTDVARTSSPGLNKIKTQQFGRASASKTKLTQANLLITLGIVWSYLMYWR